MIPSEPSRQAFWIQFSIVEINPGIFPFCCLFPNYAYRNFPFIGAEVLQASKPRLELLGSSFGISYQTWEGETSVAIGLYLRDINAILHPEVIDGFLSGFVSVHI
jgi:hypothetical protein